jgi:hypothetical protein
VEAAGAAIAAAGALLLLSAPLHWSAKTMALIIGLIMAAACVIAIVDGKDVFGVAAANRATMVVMGAAAIALFIVAMLPRIGRRRDVVVEDDAATTRNGRFMRRRRDRAADEPVGTTTERRV